MKIITHRGGSEIGAACVEFQSDSGARILIDAGLELYGKKAELLEDTDTLDAVFPNVERLYGR